MTRDDPPFVSLIIPCREERASIGRCLDSVLAGDYPMDRLEILVVDGMSADGTRELIGSYSERHSIVRLLDNPLRITPAALNRGIEEARGDIIMRMDAHATIEPDYVRKCVEGLRSHGADNVGGTMRTYPQHDGLFGRAIVRVLSHAFGVGNSRFRTRCDRPREVDTVFGGCYPRSVIERVGRFNENLPRGQDMEFNLRLRKTGGRILLLPDIVCTYYARSDVFSFLKQNWVNGVWAILPFARSAVVPVSLRHLVPLFFVTGLLACGALALGVPWGKWLLAAIGGSYCLANLAASIHAGILERDLRLALSAPPMFAALHLAYGAGSLWGLLRVVWERAAVWIVAGALAVLALRAYKVVLPQGVEWRAGGDYAAAAGVALLLAAWAAGRRADLSLRRFPAVGALLVYSLFLTSTCLYSADPIYGLHKCSLLLLVGVTCMTGGALLADRARVAGICLSLLAAGGAVHGLALLPGRFPEGALGADYVSAGRNAGTAVLILFVCLLGATTRPLLRAAFWAALVPLLMAVLGSNSRAAVVFGCAVPMAAALLVAARRRSTRELGCAAGFAVSVLAALAMLWICFPASSAKMAGRMSATIDGAQVRWEMNLAALKVFLGHPVAGAGAGSFAAASAGGTGARYPHNLVTETLAEGGAAAGILLLLLAVVLARDARRTAGMARESGVPAATVICAASLTAYFALFACVRGDFGSNALLWLSAGLLSGTAQRRTS